MAEEIDLLRKIVADYDKIVKERDQLREDIKRISEFVGVPGFCIPSGYMELFYKNKNTTQTDLILAVLEDANILLGDKGPIYGHNFNEFRKKRNREEKEKK